MGDDGRAGEGDGDPGSERDSLLSDQPLLDLLDALGDGRARLPLPSPGHELPHHDQLLRLTVGLQADASGADVLLR